jgi:hypothetical protein
MVHALTEIWRVLVPAGFLIDLRPFQAKPPLEYVADEEVTPVGFIDSTAGVPDDHAANAAITHMTGAGLFSLELDDSFELRTYWDSSAEFLTYMDNRTSSTLPPAVRSFLAPGFPDNTILRSRHHMIIARYRKQSS